MTLIIDVFTAYLEPLLKKHDAGKYLVWEDLETSHAASREVLKSQDNFFVSKRIEDLHKSQVQVYREAALKALREWAQSSAVPLQPMEENDTEDSFVERCVVALAKVQLPHWKVENAKAVVTFEIRKRAKAVYTKYHPDEEPEEGEDEESGEEVEEEEGEEGEEGEMESDGQKSAELADSSKSTTKPQANNKANLAKKQQRGTKANTTAKTQAVRKKGTVAKQATPTTRAQAARKGPGGNRGRRGGRAGGNVKNN